jgi:hypothetical protein
LVWLVVIMKYKWQEKAICLYYYEAESGRISGTVSQTSFSDDVWHARVHGDQLGDYISQKHAKEAVEKYIYQMEEDRRNVYEVPRTL